VEARTLEAEWAAFLIPAADQGQSGAAARASANPRAQPARQEREMT